LLSKLHAGKRKGKQKYDHHWPTVVALRAFVDDEWVASPLTLPAADSPVHESDAYSPR
jgi:hypothetical protein